MPQYNPQIWQASKTDSTMENGRHYKALRRVKAAQLLDWSHVLSPLSVKTQRAPSTREPLSCTRVASGDQAGWEERSGTLFLL